MSQSKFTPEQLEAYKEKAVADAVASFQFFLSAARNGQKTITAKEHFEVFAEFQSRVIDKAIVFEQLHTVPDL